MRMTWMMLALLALTACGKDVPVPSATPVPSAKELAVKKPADALPWHMAVSVKADLATYEVESIHLQARTAIVNDDYVPLLVSIEKANQSASDTYRALIQDDHADADIGPLLKAVYAAHLNFNEGVSPRVGESRASYESRIAGLRADFDRAVSDLEVEMELKYPSPPRKK